MGLFDLGWFSTGRDQAARDLLEAIDGDIREGVIPGARVSFVFCNREEGDARESDLFIRQVRGKNIPLVCFSSARFLPGLRREGLVNEKSGDTRALRQWRLQYDREVMGRLVTFSHRLIVLAGYMLVAGEEMCREYAMVNLHPARPGGPEGSWQEVTLQLMKQGAAESGVMMHLVTPELDQGPPVTYCRYGIRGGPFDRGWGELEEKVAREGDFLSRGGITAAAQTRLFHRLREAGLAREFPLIRHTVKVFARGDVRIEGGRVVEAATGKPLEGGYDLTEMVEKQL